MKARWSGPVHFWWPPLPPDVLRLCLKYLSAFSSSLRLGTLKVTGWLLKMIGDHARADKAQRSIRWLEVIGEWSCEYAFDWKPDA
jgi:hypothetical protein